VRQRPYVYLQRTEGDPVVNLIRYLIFGRGEFAPVTREMPARAESNRMPYCTRIKV
jgi:hypothetical protein